MTDIPSNGDFPNGDFSPDNPSQDDLLRYLAGTLPDADAERVRTYIDATPGRQGVFAGLGALLRRDVLVAGPRTPDDAWLAQLFRAIDEHSATHAVTADVVPGSSATTSPRTQLRHLWQPRRAALRWMLPALGAAAAIAVIAVTSQLGLRTTAPDRWVDGHTYTTHVGQTATVRLPDGTTARLAPSTTLTLDARFGGTERRLKLSGHARFAVVNGTTTPFQVQTGTVTTRVLGTAFTVRHYPTDTVVQVMVESGRVMARGRGAPVTLSAGDVAHVTDSAATVLRGTEPEQSVDWANHLLVFRGTPVPEMLATVGRWYGVEFRLADSTLSIGRVSATVDVNDRERTFKVLQAVLDASLTMDGNTIILSRRRNAPRDRLSSGQDPVRADGRSFHTSSRTPTMERGR